jgi:hypothetical protein
VATCVNVDGLEWRRGKWGLLARKTFLRAANEAVRKADALVFDSQELAKVWRSQFGRSGHFIPYGAPVLNERSDVRLREAGLPLSGYVLAVARIVPENNVDLLLDSLPRLAPTVPVIVVGDANYEHHTVDRLRSLSSAGRIIWLGHVDDQALLDELWMHAGVYWHGHSVGGTNPALLQALGAGAPTLALDTPFNREVINHDRQLVPPDAAELARRIEELLASSQLAEEFRRRGQKLIAERYVWRDVCAAYERLLLDAADARSHQGKPIPRRRRGGWVVAVVGPDGAGKSTLTEELGHAIAARRRADLEVVNFRSRYLDRLLGRRAASSTDHGEPHVTPVRNVGVASLKTVALWADLVLSALVWRRRRQITLVERYAYDLVIDPARLGIARAPRHLREGAVRLAPAPDAIVLCAAPAALLHARKPELTEAEIVRQYSVWKQLRRRLDVPCFEVETTEPVDVNRLAAQLLAVFER